MKYFLSNIFLNSPSKLVHKYFLSKVTIPNWDYIFLRETHTQHQIEAGGSASSGILRLKVHWKCETTSTCSTTRKLAVRSITNELVGFPSTTLSRSAAFTTALCYAVDFNTQKNTFTFEGILDVFCNNFPKSNCQLLHENRISFWLFDLPCLENFFCLIWVHLKLLKICLLK